MALTTQEQQFVNDLVYWAGVELQQRTAAEQLAARWNLNDFFNGIQDADLQAVPSLGYLTNSKLANGINVVNAIVTLLGDNVSGQAVNLIELKG